ncbi:MAG: DUF2339 domain-containing protein [Verrucomicrobiota bacterium]
MNEGSVVLLVLIVLGAPLALTIWLIARAVSARNRIEELTRRLGFLELEVARLRREAPSAAEASKSAPVPQPAAPPAASAPMPAPPPVLPRPVVSPAPLRVPAELVRPAPPRPASPPPAAAVPPVLPRPAAPAINWEQFLGVKMFAWVGGLALFLGVAFFVKYSFDRNWITPELRVIAGFLIGLGLLVGGVILNRKPQYAVGAQTLCATGVLTLYGVTFACKAVYGFLNAGSAFGLMVLVTAVAFLLAARLNALVVAILGMLGGFLTPILFSTGQDSPGVLFGYLAILDAGLLVLAANRRWWFLAALAAAGTGIMELGWMGKFLVLSQYTTGNRILVPFAVLLGFVALFTAAAVIWRRRVPANRWIGGSALGLAALAFVFTAWFLGFATLAHRPWLMFGFVFLVDAAVAWIAWLDAELAPAQPLAGLAVFGLLTFWTLESLSNELLPAALGLYFIFALFHTAMPVVLKRRHPAGAFQAAGSFFPPLALALVLVPILQFAEVTFMVWPFVFLVDVVAIVLAAVTASLLPVAVVLLLTFAATGALIFKIPVTLTGLPESFLLLGFFAVFFAVIATWAVRKLKPASAARGISWEQSLSDPDALPLLLPACSAVLPFLLLIMAVLRLPLANPAPVFGLALLLCVLTLGISKLFAQDWLPAVGLACVAALEAAWHFNRFEISQASSAVAWYVLFYALFTAYPFAVRSAARVVPWATAACAGIPQFLLVYRVVNVAWPNSMMGLLPAAFALAPLASLALVLKTTPADLPGRLSRLACYGGVALFFITLIFPIQFERQWITVGWALEGAALLWLFHRIPHPGLRLTGVALLVAVFARLALNRAVFDYHPRGEMALLNWYLYAYGIAVACLFAGARLLAPPRNIVLRSNMPPFLNTLATLLAFLLMNIEIADYFSPPGSTLTFEFHGNFGRDMAYTICWGLFAFALLIAGILRSLKGARYAALGLLCVTLLKLFLHDLARLNELYRIGAFVGVAVIAMLASFVYQKFFAAAKSRVEDQAGKG